jgi:hypothetical protein
MKIKKKTIILTEAKCVKIRRSITHLGIKIGKDKANGQVKRETSGKQKDDKSSTK